jgi:hypothetical protein
MRGQEDNSEPIFALFFVNLRDEEKEHLYTAP